MSWSKNVNKHLLHIPGFSKVCCATTIQGPRTQITVGNLYSKDGTPGPAVNFLPIQHTATMIGLKLDSLAQWGFT
jgi:hypothetical protein